MKRLLLLALFFLSVSGFAQSTVDFETVGQDWKFTVFANGPGGDSTNFSVVPNPSVSGINTSSQVAKYLVFADADPWSGAFSTDLPDFTLDANNSIITVMVYKDVISNFNLKLEGPGFGHDNNVSNTVINQWEQLTFDYTADIGKAIATLTIIPDFPATRTAGSTNYFDNIDFGTVVPVELTSFTAALVGSDVQLKWKTATETNNSGFEIQRSANKTEFTKIGFVEGSGTTTETKSYSFADRNINTGVNYSYRLKQIDFNGKHEYSQVVNIGSVTPSEFALEQNYPNPFNPSTNISFAVPVKSNVTLEVYNLIGQKVMDLVQGEFEAGKHSVQLNGSSMASGIYLFKLTAVGENGSMFSSSKKMTLLK